MNRREVLLGAALAPLAGATPALAHVKPGERTAARGAPFKLALAAYSYRELLQGARKSMSLFEFIEKSAALGTDGVELTEYYFEKPITPETVMRLKRHAHLWGQSITGTPMRNEFTHPAGPERERQVRLAQEWLEVSAALGSPAVRMFAGTAPKGVSEAEARRNVIETLGPVCEHAAKRGVFVAIENHGGVVATADGLMEIVEAVESPWLGVNLDTGNFHSADPYADLARVAPYAVTVQFKVEVSPNGGPAQRADFPRVLRILREAGYRGFVTLEYEAKEDPLVAVPRWLGEMRAAILRDAAG